MAYLLAKDECVGAEFDGPQWVPFNLWSHYAFGSFGPNPALSKECAKKLIFSPESEKIWGMISDRYEAADSIASKLPARGTEFLDHWRIIPKVSPAEYREAKQNLARRAKQLAEELARFFDYRDYEDAGAINFTQLLTEQEQLDFYAKIQTHNFQIRCSALRGVGFDQAYLYADYASPADPSKPASPLNILKCASDTGLTETLLIGDGEDAGIIPDLPDMLHRIASLFADEAQLPPLQRPHAENAGRNYFVRRLIGYFVREHGAMSPTIVARIASIFFSQGITDNEVTKQMKFLPDGRRWPPKVKLHV